MHFIPTPIRALVCALLAAAFCTSAALATRPTSAFARTDGVLGQVLACIDRQRQLNSYKITTKGEIVAKKGLTYTQKVDNVAVKTAEGAFTQTSSSGVFIKVVHQAFVPHGGRAVAYRNATGGDPIRTTRTRYRAEYGLLPDEENLGGLTVNANTVLRCALLSPAAEARSFVIELDPDSVEAVGAMRMQMKKFGGLKSLPEFTALTLTLTAAPDDTPVRLTIEAAYRIDIAVLGRTECTQRLTAVYSEIGESPTIPDLTAFRAALAAPPHFSAEIFRLAIHPNSEDIHHFTTI